MAIPRSGKVGIARRRPEYWHGNVEMVFLEKGLSLPAQGTFEQLARPILTEGLHHRLIVREGIVYVLRPTSGPSRPLLTVLLPKVPCQLESTHGTGGI